MKVLSIVKLVSEIVLIWGFVLIGWMKLQATTDCLQFRAPRAELSTSGVICVTVVEGTEYLAPLSVLRDRAEQKNK